MTILFSFIGNSDLIAAGVRPSESAQSGPGPISRAIDSPLGPWAQVVLVDERMQADVARRYLQWLQSRHPAQAMQAIRSPLANPADFGAALAAARQAVQTACPGGAERAYLTTPGTAAMAMAWMYLALQPGSQARLLTAHIDQPCAWLEVPGTGPRECVILRGIPGAGKSTRARELARRAGAEYGATVFCTDDRFDEFNGGVFDPPLLPRMHQTNLAMFIAALARGTPLVVCDNTNIEPWEYEAYAAAARALGYRVTLQVVGQPDDEAFVRACVARNRRGLSEERIRDMARRLQAQLGPRTSDTG